MQVKTSRYVTEFCNLQLRRRRGEEKRNCRLHFSMSYCILICHTMSYTTTWNARL